MSSTEYMGDLLESLSEGDEYLAYSVTPEEAACIAVVLRDFTESRKSLVQTMHPKWDDALKHYYQKPQIKRPRGQANIASPISTEYIDTLIAISLDMFMPSDEVSIGVKGFEGADKPLGKTMTDLISYQIQHQNGREIFREMFFNFFCYGTAPCKIIYDEEYQEIPIRRELRIPGIDYSFGSYVEKVRMLKYKGPKLIPIDPFDFYPAKTIRRIKDGSAICHTFYPTLEYLEEQEQQGIYQNVEFIRHITDRLAFKDDDNFKKERKEIIGVDLHGGETEGGIECIEWQGLYKNEQGKKVPHIIVVGPGPVLLRKEEMTFIDESNNYEVMSLFRSGNEFWGQGIPMKHDMILHSIDALWNVALDAMYQNVNSPLLVHSGGQIKDRELINRAGQVIHVTADEGQPVSNYISRLVGTPVLPDVYTFQSKLEDFAQGVSAGQNDIVSGSLPSVRQTATAVQQSTTHASIRHKDVMKMAEATGILPIVRKFHKINRAFLDTPYVTAVIGKQGMFWDDAIAPQQIAMDVDFVCYASSREMDRPMNIQQLEHFLQIVMGSPEMMPLAVPIAMKIAEEMRLPNYDEIEQRLNWLMQQKVMFDQQLQESQLAYNQFKNGMQPQIPMQAQSQGGGAQIPSTLNTGELLNQVNAKNRVNVGGYMPQA